MIKQIDWSGHESSFDTAVNFVLGHEGGYANRKKEHDPGGETNFGISAKQYGKDYDIKNLTQETALNIYRRDYWDAVELSRFPEPIALQVFQMGVVGGQGTSIGLLQKLVGTELDYTNGPITEAAVKKAYAEDPQKLIDGLAKAQLDHLKTLKNFKHNPGWVTRISDSQLAATESRIRYAERRAAIDGAVAELDSQGDLERPAPEPEELVALSDFGTAFKTARESGAKVFDYKGKKYTTELKTG